MKSLMTIVLSVFALTSFAAEPAKAPVVTPAAKAPAKKPAAEKKCDPLKQKDCKKAEPSANKPVPKKQAEPK